MKKNVMLVIVVMLIVVAIVGLQLMNTMQSSSNHAFETQEKTQSDTSGDAMQAMDDSDVMKENDDAMQAIDDSGYTGEVLAGDSSPYITFTKQGYDKALREDKIILLYFYANWCPICIDEEQEVFDTFNSLERDDIVGFRVNYRDSDVDSFEEQLAKEHGITYQHTKVILQHGEQVIKAPNSWNTEKYEEEFAKL